VWRLLTKWDPSLRHVMICGHNPGLSQVASRFGPKPQRRDLPPAGLATAVWTNAEWHSMQPETAASCDLDDPESMADLWA
jgi:phosphohistidine phosphatase SixA